MYTNLTKVSEVELITKCATFHLKLHHVQTLQHVVFSDCLYIIVYITSESMLFDCAYFVVFAL